MTREKLELELAGIISAGTAARDSYRRSRSWRASIAEQAESETRLRASLERVQRSAARAVELLEELEAERHLFMPPGRR